MEGKLGRFPGAGPQGAANYDELFMQHSLLFADSLKDLRSLRKQLYSAAEYFEVSYGRDDHKQLVVETLKDYVTKAIVGTVDHLGSVAYKVNNFLDDEVDEFSATKLRFCCLEQKLRGYQEFVDQSGLSQQSLIIATPKHHKHYIVPAGEAAWLIGKNESVQENCSPVPDCSFQKPRNTVQGMKMESRASTLRKGHYRLPSTEASSGPVTFAFAKTTNNQQQKRAVSPLRFPIKRSGSVNISVSPKPNNAKPPTPEPWRSVSMSNRAVRDRTREIQLYSKRSRNLFKALLSMRKQ